MIKRLMVATLVATSVVTAIPTQKAEAGVVIGMYSGTMACLAYIVDSDRALRQYTELGVASIAIGIGGGVALLATRTNWGLASGTFLVALDQANSVSANDLARVLSKTYSFIDNRDVINRLANVMALHYDEQKDENGVAIVTISDEETRAILSLADLSSDETDRVVNDLH